METKDRVTAKSRKTFAHINWIETLSRNLIEAPPERIRFCLPRLLRILSVVNRIGESEFTGWKHFVVRRGRVTTDASYAYRALFSIKEVMAYLGELPPECVEKYCNRLALCESLLDSIYDYCWPTRRGGDGWDWD